MWGAGLSFHRCHAEINVPVDPYLDGVFDGEEGSRGIRFFTHGYDVYTPDKVLVTHDYHGHQNNPVVHTWGRGIRRKNEEEENEDKDTEGIVFEDNWKWMAEIESKRSQWHTFGTKRVNMLLSIGSYFNSTQKEAEEVELIRHSRFGLGSKRTLQQVRNFTGINLVEEKMETNKCGNLNWIPFDEASDYGVDETLARAYGANDVILHSTMAAAAVLDELKMPSKRLRSLSDNKPIGSNLESRQGSTQVLPGDSILDFRIIGFIIIAGLGIAKWSAQKFRQKDTRHSD